MRSSFENYKRTVLHELPKISQAFVQFGVAFTVVSDFHIFMRRRGRHRRMNGCSERGGMFL
jgi:hypothetical protein